MKTKRKEGDALKERTKWYNEALLKLQELKESNASADEINMAEYHVAVHLSYIHALTNYNNSD